MQYNANTRIGSSRRIRRGGEVQAQVIRTNHATFAPIEMTQHQNQREQYGERAECHEDGHMRTGRNEGEHVAGVRAKEA